MDDSYLSGRINDILRQKIAMGAGCGSCDGCDCSMSGGVLLGGGNVWTNFLKEYSAKKGISYRDAMTDPRAKKAYAKYKADPVKTRSPKKRKTPVRSTSRSLRALNADTKRIPKKELTKYQRKRVGKRYENRGKNLQCLRENPRGDYRLNSNYRCLYEPLKKKKRRRTTK
jgi:hypothetical protein